MSGKKNLIWLIAASILISSCNRLLIPGMTGRSVQKASARIQSMEKPAREENVQSGASARQQAIRDPYNEDSNITYDGHTLTTVNQRSRDTEDYNSNISYSSHRLTGPGDTEKVLGVGIKSPDLKLAEGDEKIVEAGVRFSGGGKDENVRWESSDQSVARIDSSGKIEAVSGGSATISAYSMENFAKKDTINVTVEADHSKTSDE
jgi:hypothetical protein